jgi:hypothetical protein
MQLLSGALKEQQVTQQVILIENAALPQYVLIKP